MRLPSEHRLRVVDDDIVHSPVTAVETSDALMVVDSPGRGADFSTDSISSAGAAEVIRGKKRGRKSKGSNVPGARSLSKMSATSMEVYEVDMLDQSDFLDH